KTNFIVHTFMWVTLIAVTSCSIPQVEQREANKITPENYAVAGDTTNSASVDWHQFFSDPYLTSLIDTALVNNQELNIMMKEIMIASNEIMARKGEYLPSLDL